ncbi:hypothetical protein [Actinotalea sp. K2]|uniref:hypothetical protein n=1 Tax=Actinotalea sp. K2 TaxID=2939438 RepID=UPI002016C06B|nr:hypothetical protein [Actinotalea sp. K2]MCL3862052.1 hypothetical protein [Actinotalea sp. K2]
MSDLDDDARDVRTRITLRDHDQLRRTLVRIEAEGWDGPTGRGLLEFVRQDMIRRMVVGLGLRGTAAYEAEATGWAAAWEALNAPRLAEAELPWSLVHAAARRAVLGELLAARYATGVRRAWEIRNATRGSGCDPRVVPVDDLTGITEGREATADGASGLLDAALSLLRDRLVELGWDDLALDAVVDALLDARLTVGSGGACTGWRPLSADIGVAPWRVRRLAVALLGGPQWPGMIARVVREGAGVLESRTGRAALESTVRRRWRSPLLQAERAAAVTPADRGTSTVRAPS